jgi:hypothetical protein
VPSPGKRESTSAARMTFSRGICLIQRIATPLKSSTGKTDVKFSVGVYVPASERVERCMEPTQPHSNGSLTGPYDIRRLAAAVEALNNLIYLASRDGEKAEQVRTYLKLAEGQVASLTQLLGRRIRIG